MTTPNAPRDLSDAIGHIRPCTPAEIRAARLHAAEHAPDDGRLGLADLLDMLGVGVEPKVAWEVAG